MYRPADNTCDRIEKRHHDRRSNLAEDYKAGNMCDRSNTSDVTRNGARVTVRGSRCAGHGARVTVRSSPTPNVHRGERRYHVKKNHNYLLHLFHLSLSFKICLGQKIFLSFKILITSSIELCCPDGRTTRPKPSYAPDMSDYYKIKII